MNESRTKALHDGQPRLPKRRRFSEESKRDTVWLVVEEGCIVEDVA